MTLIYATNPSVSVRDAGLECGVPARSGIESACVCVRTTGPQINTDPVLPFTQLGEGLPFQGLCCSAWNIQHNLFGKWEISKSYSWDTELLETVYFVLSNMIFCQHYLSLQLGPV